LGSEGSKEGLQKRGGLYVAMRNAVTPWSYRKGSTLLHRLPAGYKLAFLLLLSLASFFPGTETQSLVLLGIIVAILIALSFVAGIGPWALLRGSGPLFLVILWGFLLQAVEFSPLKINPSGFLAAIIFSLRIGAAFSAGTLLFSVTTPYEIRKSLSRLETFLRIKKIKLSLYISLMLGFLPQFFEVWEDLCLAWKSRAGKKNLSFIIIIVPIAVEKMMRKAAETAIAMEARGA
jgi:energy-coupling factor transporter transmembrane protein EcfT